MSDQAWDQAERLHQLADAIGEGGHLPADVAELLGRLQGGGGQPPGQPGAPGGSSTVQPEATPPPTPQPLGIGQLPGLVDDVARKAAVMGEQDQRDALWTLAETVNASLDANAREQSPHLYPKPPANNDEELAALAGRINQAGIDPNSLDEHARYALAEELNATISGINDEHLRRVDDFEQQRAAAERQREARARQQDTAARDLRALANRLDGAAAPSGR